jgi:hydroxymethylpyrimidine/phosphomethylpyrimidine kinase
MGDLRPVLTPNLGELAELTGASLGALARDLDARIAAARGLLALGAVAVCVKGGHGQEDPVRDLLVRAAGELLMAEHPRLPGPGMRGSGCRFASYLAGRLALSEPLARAHAEASSWMGRRMAAPES